jgi:hypothetical protein
MISGKWSEKEVIKLKRLVKEYSRYNKITPKLNRNKSSVSNKVRSLGLRLKSNVNEDFFYQKDEISYYILGYWFADGCIMKKSGGYYFSIVSNDVKHLLRIKKEMEITTKLYKNSNDAYEIRVGNKKLIENMINHFQADYRKTHTTEIPYEIIPDKYFYDFLRGYFDGDGSVILQKYKVKSGEIRKTLSNVKFTGAEKIINSLKRKLKVGTVREDKRKINCLYLSFYGDNMRKLLTKMYKGAKIKLERKYKIYLSEVENK